MNRSKKLILAGALTVGIGTGAVMFTPQAINASSNVVLASVDWVTSQLNPMKTKLSQLEAKIASQDAEIKNLKSQIADGGSGSTPVPPVTPPQGQLPSVVYVSKASAKVHSGATASYKVVATKSKGSSLKVIDSHTGSTGVWYRVELSATVKGWIFSGDTSTSKPSSTGTTVVLFGEANIRKGATTGYPVIQTLPKGTSLKYISSFTNAQGEVWHNVQTASGAKGWVIGTLGEVR